jgi:hypothetical protein
MMGVLEVFFGAYCPCIDFGQAFTFDARLSDVMGLVATFEAEKTLASPTLSVKKRGKMAKKPGLA